MHFASLWKDTRNRRTALLFRISGMLRMRYIDGEMDNDERVKYVKHLETCDKCRQSIADFSMLKEVTETMKIADLPEVVWDKYWEKIYNRIERSVAWFIFIIGALILSSYWIYKVITDPELYNIVGLGVVLMVVGLAILFLSVLKEKLTVNKSDKYISEVKR